MRVLIQRVTRAAVTVDSRKISEIGKGLFVLLGIGKEDTAALIAPLVNKISNLRIFEDEAKKTNLSLRDVSGQLLVVSQFTLYADCTRGRRPSFIDAAPPDYAKNLYEQFIAECKKSGLAVSEGQFQAMMDIELINSGPFTIVLDTAVP